MASAPKGFRGGPALALSNARLKAPSLFKPSAPTARRTGPRPSSRGKAR
jgi:hypothetical protein